MKCKCGGELKRIAVDCYECEKCHLKHKVAFMELPKKDKELDKTAKINIGIVGAPRTNIAELIKEMGKNQMRFNKQH